MIGSGQQALQPCHTPMPNKSRVRPKLCNPVAETNKKTNDAEQLQTIRKKQMHNSFAERVCTHLLNGVVAGSERAADRMADLVVRDQALGLAIHQGLALHTRNNAVDRVVNLTQRDRCAVAATRENGCLVEQVGEVSSREAGRAQRDLLQGDLRVGFSG